MSNVSTNEFYVSCTRRLFQLLSCPPDAELSRKLWQIDDLGELKNFLYGFLQKNNSEHRKFINDLLVKWKTRGPISGKDFVVYKKTDIVDEFAVRSKSKKAPKPVPKPDEKPQSLLNSLIPDKPKTVSPDKNKDQSPVTPTCHPEKPKGHSPSNTSQSTTLKTTVSNQPTPGTHHEKKTKSKFVPLFSDKGQKRAVARLPGRHSCECQAIKHTLIANCTGCGRIVCSQEGSGPCYFCGKLVCTREEQNILNAKDKKSEQLMAKLLGPSPLDAHLMQPQSEILNLDKGFQKALEMKDRLLEFDRTSQKQTQVIDDESDYYATDSNQWLTEEERGKLKKKKQLAYDTKHASRRTVTVTLDFAGRRVVESEKRFIEINDEEVLSDTMNYQATLHNIDFDDGSNIPRPQFDESVCRNTEVNGARPSQKFRQTKFVNQCKDLQEIVDEGKCLSLHQPYASLLVCGLKIHEGRTWYTAFRGLLWIASAAKEASPQDIKQVEGTVRSFHAGDIKFPDRYPVSALLGCVNVGDCLPQEEYRQQFHDGESRSPYVLICGNAQELVVKFPIKGNHKIYKLEPHIHEAAKKTIKRCHDY